MALSLFSHLDFKFQLVLLCALRVFFYILSPRPVEIPLSLSWKFQSRVWCQVSFSEPRPNRGFESITCFHVGCSALTFLGRFILHVFMKHWMSWGFTDQCTSPISSEKFLCEVDNANTEAHWSKFREWMPMKCLVTNRMSVSPRLKDHLTREVEWL